MNFSANERQRLHHHRYQLPHRRPASPNAHPRRLLGRLVRPVQGARANAGTARGRLRRAAEDRQARDGQEPEDRHYLWRALGADDAAVQGRQGAGDADGAGLEGAARQGDRRGALSRVIAILFSSLSPSRESVSTSVDVGGCRLTAHPRKNSH